MIEILCAGTGGFVGAVMRFAISDFIKRWLGDSFPLGTLFVNFMGCFVIGGVMLLVEHRQFLAPNSRLFIMVGILGSLTTFSTFGYETIELVRSGQTQAAFINVAANILLGLGGVALGWITVRTFAV